ncbi:hypothetical protein ElyMa_000575800 [Elysia marginata]|uniref:Uncharacterized protein n=1 Tax=Elysia marginata TaxID=1093978 RepID=A0AAV4G4X0_9GAST|nr:hypothetical protein ElyMa_000575800 [Elysia marginata]
MEMVAACMQKATGTPNKASPVMDPSGTKKQRTAEGYLGEDGAKGSERNKSLLRNGSPTQQRTGRDGALAASSTRRLRED